MDNKDILELNNNHYLSGKFLVASPFMPLNEIFSKSLITLKKWYHIAFVQKDNTGTLYLNGNVIVTKSNIKPPQNVVRNSNFIGKSNWNGDGLANAIIDEIKIYNVPLTNQQVLNELNFGDPIPIPSYVPQNYWSFNGNYNDYYIIGKRRK